MKPNQNPQPKLVSVCMRMMMKQCCRLRSSSQPPYSYFPEEIVFDILVRLPVKSLLRFKSVCKSWRDLISDQKFAKSQLNYAANRSVSSGIGGVLDNYLDPERYGVLYSDRKPRPSLNFISVTNRGGGDCEAVVVKVGSDHPFSCDDVNILGSCNGLLFVTTCVSSSREHLLWNPSTGEYKKIFFSTPDECSLEGRAKNYQMSGLGYDSSVDEYKAIVIYQTSPLAFRGRQPPEDVAVSIYSCKTGTTTCTSKMKYFTEFSYFDIVGSLPSVTVNGSPHWVVTRLMTGYGDGYRAIIYFDMEEEIFKEVSRPDSFSQPSQFNVEVLGGCLCVVDDRGGLFAGFDVWAMKEYGVKESWTKLFAIETPFMFVEPLLGFTRSSGEEVLIHVDGTKLVNYNVHTGRQDTIFSANGVYTCVAIYLKSLVSFDGLAAGVGVTKADGEAEGDHLRLDHNNRKGDN